MSLHRVAIIVRYRFSVRISHVPVHALVHSPCYNSGIIPYTLMAIRSAENSVVASALGKELWP